MLRSAARCSNALIAGDLGGFQGLWLQEHRPFYLEFRSRSLSFGCLSREVEMGRYMQDSSERPFFLDVLKIALGVFVGSLLAVLAYEQILALRVDSAAREAMQHLQKQSADLAAQAQRTRLAQEREREERARRDRDEREERARMDRERDAAQRASAEAARAREERRRLAWERFYQPSAACREDPATLPCANAHMAARKRFDAEYVDR